MVNREETRLETTQQAPVGYFAFFEISLLLVYCLEHFIILQTEVLLLFNLEHVYSCKVATTTGRRTVDNHQSRSFMSSP
jgi:hypothetical protein